MNEINNEEVKYSTKIHVSFGMASFLDGIFVAAFSVRIIDFYENELLLGIIWVGVAFGIFGLWNMVNDPLLGYLSDLNNRITRKYGRRFPVYLFGALTFGAVYFLVFVVPFRDQFGMFIWLVTTICVYELLFSLWQIGWLSLFPDKFRSNKERTKVGAWCTIWGVIGMVMGVSIPPMFIEYGNVSTYILAAAVLMVIGLLMTLLTIPGMREDEEIIERNLRLEGKSKEKDSFWTTLKYSLKDKNFLAYIITYLCHQTLTVMMLASLPYWVKYVIGSDDPGVETMLSLGFLVGVIAAIPLWAYIGRKMGNRKGFIIGAFTTTILIIPLLIVSDAIGSTIAITLVGVGVAAIWVLMFPCFSDVIDDIVVRTEKRQEGVYTGIRTFFGRISFIVQAVAFAIVHPLTGYQAGAPIGGQTPLAIFGIRILMAIVPMMFYFIGFIMMWKVYDLEKSCVAENKEILLKRLL
ncbi:MAG: MFS transporter [Candidatus Lokiarchaeota archaeon]|nr:MFS transporter [Candidatus Lokiarchaeota archaeon]MBD3339950.1 MFS transporter [Candidatus Lokiarchaeota archaeon]